jgi:hypothetical protein
LDSPGSLWNKTVVRGGFGMFYENFNGLNYRNSVVSNGLLSQQASVSLGYDNSLAPNQQLRYIPKSSFRSVIVLIV